MSSARLTLAKLPVVPGYRQPRRRNGRVMFGAALVAMLVIAFASRRSSFPPEPGSDSNKDLPAIVASSPALSAVNRIGLNLGNQSQFSDADYMQNMFDNPGFEPGQECWIFMIATSSAGGFTVSNDNGEANNFWNGASASIRSGTGAGGTFTVGTFTSGGNFTCSGACPVMDGKHPYNGGGPYDGLPVGGSVAICQTGDKVGLVYPGYQAFGGWSLIDREVAPTTMVSYEGAGSMAFNVSDGSSHVMQYYWDTATSTGGVCANDNTTLCTLANAATDCSGNACLTAPQAGPFHPIMGSFKLTFYAKTVNTSSPKISVSLTRASGTNNNHSFSLANDGNWHQYEYDFTGGDTAVSAQNQLMFKMAASNGSAESGATIYVDDAYLGRAEASATGFRDEVVNTLMAMAPGTLRDNYQLVQNDANWEGPGGCSPGSTATGGCDFLKGAATGSSSTPNPAAWVFAAQDTDALAHAVGATPWYSIPNTFNDADLKRFIDIRCATFSKYNFGDIYVEQSNEDWNGALPNVAHFTNDSGYYGMVAGRNFNLMNTEAMAVCPSYAGRIHYIIGNQTSNSGVVAKAMIGAQAAHYPVPNTSQYGSDDETYNGGGTAFSSPVASYSGTLRNQATQYAAFFAQFPSAVLFGKTGVAAIPTDISALGSKNAMSVYETGVSGLAYKGSTFNTEQSYLAQAGFPAAMWMGEDWLLATQAGIATQNVFTLGQNEYCYNHVCGPMWGINHDLDSDFGPTFPHLRPTALAIAVINSAMGGSYYPVSGMSAGTYANAFENGGNWSAALINTNPLPIQITLKFPSTGILPASTETVVYTKDITDNNENSNNVKIEALAGGLNAAGRNVTVTLPPYSLVALDPSGSTLPSSLRKSNPGTISSTKSKGIPF